MGEPRPPSSSLRFRDRGRALVAFGWVLIAVGALCGLMALLFAALALLARAAPGGPSVAINAQSVFFNVALYLCLGAGFVTLGVGSIRARRWARALTVVVAWVWLATGALGLLATALFVPKLLSGIPMGGASPPGMMTCVLLFTLLFFTLFFVLLPLTVLLFYRREDVRQTVEARSPDPDWTDRAPLSIVGVVLALGLGGVVSILSIPVTTAVPIFGVMLTGWPAALVLLFFGVVSLLLGLGVYRRAAVAWWG